MGSHAVQAPEPSCRAMLCFPTSLVPARFSVRGCASLPDTAAHRVRLADLIPCSQKNKEPRTVPGGFIIQRYVSGTDTNPYSSCRLNAARLPRCEVTNSPLLSSAVPALSYSEQKTSPKSPHKRAQQDALKTFAFP